MSRGPQGPLPLWLIMVVVLGLLLLAAFVVFPYIDLLWNPPVGRHCNRGHEPALSETWPYARSRIPIQHHNM